MKNKDLTDKQKLFVDEYLIDLNATQAAIRAGYSEKTAKDIACENLAKPNIADAIAKAQQERSSRTLISADEVIKGLKEEALGTGEGTTPASRVSAWGLLGKHLGMFVDRKVIESPVDNRSVEEFTTEELTAMIRKGMELDRELTEAELYEQ